MTTPCVSVLITAFNRAHLIRAAIESVLRSTFTNFELIIVDDASSDDTAAVARGFEGRDGRLRVYVNESRLGDYGNRSKAAGIAVGEYLKYVDSDDVIYAHGLDVMVGVMNQHPAAALGLSRPPLVDQPFPVQLWPTESYRMHFLGDGLFNNSPLSTIIRRDAFERVGGFSGRRFLGDTELWLKLGRKHPVVLMPSGLTWWRPHDQQEFAWEVASGEAVVPRFDLAMEMIGGGDSPLTLEEQLLARRRIHKAMVVNLLASVRRGRLSLAIRIARRIASRT